jgi:signal transduction histidine kinase
VRKHSGVTHVQVKFDRSDGRLRLIIQDDGCGFPFSGCFSQSDLEGDGKGRMLIKECVRSMNGELLLESINRRGSRLEITIPQKWQSSRWVLKDRIQSH